MKSWLAETLIIIVFMLTLLAFGFLGLWAEPFVTRVVLPPLAGILGESHARTGELLGFLVLYFCVSSIVARGLCRLLGIPVPPIELKIWR